MTQKPSVITCDSLCRKPMCVLLMQDITCFFKLFQPVLNGLSSIFHVFAQISVPNTITYT